MLLTPAIVFFFFFNDTATTEIYTLSLHDALPISSGLRLAGVLTELGRHHARVTLERRAQVLDELATHAPERLNLAPDLRFLADRKSTRLNSSHLVISYAVFCLKKKKRASSQSPRH